MSTHLHLLLLDLAAHLGLLQAMTLENLVCKAEVVPGANLNINPEMLTKASPLRRDLNRKLADETLCTADKVMEMLDAGAGAECWMLGAGAGASRS